MKIDGLANLHPDHRRVLRDQLTSRQLEVANLDCAGMSERRIAAELLLSRSTIRSHHEAIEERLADHHDARHAYLALRQR